MELKKVYLASFGSWCGWVRDFHSALEKTEKPSCWKSSAVPFSLAVFLLLVTIKINSSWSFAWKLILNFCSCHLLPRPRPEPFSSLGLNSKAPFLEFDSRGCCEPRVAQASARKKIEAPAGFSQTASHLGPLWLLKILCVGHGAVSSQEANKKSRDKVWASVKNLSFVFWGVLTLLWASLVAQLVKNRLQCGRTGFDPWVGKIPWRKAWQPTPVFLPGESHGQKSLVGYIHRVTKSLKWLSMHAWHLNYMIFWFISTICLSICIKLL